jgi:hypothetical protein
MKVFEDFQGSVATRQWNWLADFRLSVWGEGGKVRRTGIFVETTT